MMNRYLRLGAFAVLFVAIAAWALTAGGQLPQSYVPRQVIVKLDPSTTTPDALDVRSSLRATVKQRFKSIGAELWVIDGISVSEAVDRFKDDPRVDYIEPNHVVRALDVFPNDPRFDDLWGMHNTGQTGGTPDADIDAPEAWDIGTGGTVIVGVIDTGVDYNHVDLAANQWTNPDEIAGNGVDDDLNGYIDDIRGWDFVNNDNNPIDDHGHGTHVSGTAAAVGNNGVGVVGVSWSARIMPLKFLDAGGFGSTSDAILAVEYATMEGAKLTSNSWGGGGFSQALFDAIEAAGNAGILFVAAAGNASSNNDVFPNFPSNYNLENIIAVASTDHNDNLSGFSNFGLTTVDLGAPGTDILSTFPNNTYGTISGTSMATPHVSGAVCLVWAAAPELTHMEVKNAIMAAVDVIPALQGRTVTGGRLNVHTVMSNLDDIAPDPINDVSVQSTGSTTALLAWTASGDDGGTGTARSYDLRYSTSPIDAGNFDLATPAAGEPAPRAAGVPESFEVSGLDYLTTYYFAVVVADEQNNRSGVSNSPNGTTLGAPMLEYAPASFSSSLQTGGMETQVLTISNTGEGTLDFAFPTGAMQSGEVVGGVAPAMLPMWLSASPSSGRVLAGQSIEVELVFDATGLSGGNYMETVSFATNDHANESAPIDVALNVTSAPDVVASPLEVDFGVRYTGSCTTLEIVVTNRGFMPLSCAGVSINNAVFGVDPQPFVLGVGQSRTIEVSYCPDAEESMPGIPRRYPRRSQAVLSLASNDPDHPTYSVPLFGDAIAPPVIVVSPTSLSEDLFTGGSATHALSIMNTGATNLEFGLAVEQLPNAVVRFGTAGETPDRRNDITPAGTKTTRSGSPYTAGRAGSGERELASTKPVITSPTALEILLVHAADVFEIQSALLAFADVAVVDAFDAGSSTPTLDDLSPYDGVILIANFPYSDPQALGDVLADYVDGGGGVVMTLASFIDGWDVGGRFFTDGYYPFTLGSGPIGFGMLAAFDASHPIMAGVSAASGDLLGATTLAPGAEWVADWNIGQPFIATQGDHVVGANVFVADGGFWSGDVALILHNAVLWSAGAAWLTADPTEGVVPPGSSLDVAVTFDAAGLIGGDYAANIRIGSNDPVTPEVVVPSGLHVTDAPDIEVPVELLAYGQVFIGGVSNKTVEVSNAGTLVLNITSIAASHPDYAVDVASMVLAPGTSQNLVVSFAPTSTGAANGSLTFTSDDPDEPSLVVALEGEGILPPIISVSPLSFEADLFTGGTDTQTMTISNSGASNLEFEINTEEVEAMGASVTQRISIPRSSGDFPRGTHAPSLHAAPTSGHASVSPSGEPTTMAALGSAFSTEIGFGQATRFSLQTPEVLTFVGPAPAFIWGGDFGGDDAAFAYAVDDLNQFMQIDTINGDQTILGTIVPFGGEIWTGMAFDPTEGLMYATSTDVFASSFYVIDVTVPSATRIGSVGFPGIIAVAVDDEGAVFAHDIVTDELVSIDKTTGTGTAIGSLGYDANFGQGMGFDAESGQLYLAAFNNASFQAELRLADRTTGATTLVGVLGQDEPGGVVQLGWLAIPGLSGVRWLIADPDAGVVPPGTSMEVAITFDAEGLFGGDYNANLLIANNDPLNPEVVATAHLHVTGAPDIAVTPNALEYGQVFIGGVSNKTVVIKNAGTDLLTVTSISTDHGDYTTDLSGVVLAPTQSQAVVVSYAPTSTGLSMAILTIASDDPDEASIAVSMTGEGLLPPIISVSPLSFEADLFTGETDTQTMTISNTGANNLEFAIDVEDLTTGAAASRTLLLRGRPWRDGVLRGGGAVGTGAEGADSRTTRTGKAIAPTKAVTAAQDPAILVIQDSDAWGVDMAMFIYDNFGFTATVINSGDIAATDFDPFDLIITVGDEGFQYYNALTTHVGKFEDFVDGGGVVQYQAATQGDDVSIVGGVQVVYGGFDNFNDVLVPDHPIVEGLPPVLEGNAANHTTLENLPPDAVVITETTNSGEPTTVEYEYGRGNVIATGMTWEFLYFNGYEAGPILGNAVAYSLSLAGVKWLQVEPSSGVVPPGNSTDIAVTFDAAGLFGGDYLANLLVANNDPLNSLVTVPATLHVTGAPDIVVTPTSLDYGPVFIGGVSNKTLEIENDGTDVLTVSSLVTTHADYTTSVANAVIPPGTSQAIIVSYAPTSTGQNPATLTLTSDDPDEPVIDIPLTGEGLEPPVIAVTPLSISEDLFTGGSASHTLTIDNSAGGSALVWSASSAFPENASRVVEASATFGAGVVVDLKKDPARSHSALRPDAGAVFAFGRHGSSPAPASTSTPLEEILENLDANFASVNSLVPNRFDFTEGETGNIIFDGGNDMYDGGNMLGTDMGGPIQYSNGVIVASTVFGTDGRYFTRKYPGLFVLVADMTDVEYFEIFGNVGADGSGNVDGAVLAADVSGTSFQGFVKRIFNAFDPSVNHLILVEEDPAASHEFATNTDDDYHRAFGLAASRRVYYALYASANGGYIDNAATLAIMEAFLNALGLAPGWVSVVPSAGSVPAGASTDVEVRFDATGLVGGDYPANILVANNDPLNPEVTVTTDLHVTGAPDVVVEPTAFDFGQLFIGATLDESLVITNDGTDVLNVSNIATSHPDYSVSASNAVLPVGESLIVTVSFAPTSVGVNNATLTITSDDPDEGVVGVSLTGEGLEPPVIAVTPTSISEDVFSGAIVYRTLNIDNSAGGSNLFWNATASTVANSSSVVEASPTFGTGPVVNQKADKEKEAKPMLSASRPDAGAMFTSPARAAASAPVAAATSLEDVLESLNTNFGSVTSLIPNRFDFTEGETGNSIIDGGNDMYDGGNFLHTNLGTGIMYSNNAVVPNGAFGIDGRYFTRKYPGLFVMVADMTDVSYFQTGGNLGADGSGNVDGAVLAAEVSGVEFQGFVKRVYNAFDPSVNHLIIVEENPAATHQFSLSTDDDYHATFGLSSSRRIYYLLYASQNGGYIDNDATLAIMEAFLGSIGLAPEWISLLPSQGTVPAGTSANIQVTLDATGLLGGDYDANIEVTSNDPVTPQVVVPVHMHVTGAPDIAVSPSFVAFGQVFVGATAVLPLHVTNNGTDVLTVSDIVSNLPQFGVDITNFSLDPGESQNVMVSCSPAALGLVIGSLTITSNDPDEGSFLVYTIGEGIEPPVISLSAASLSDDLAEGESNTQLLTVSNVGANVLDFLVSVGPGDALLPASQTSENGAVGADGKRPRDVADGGGPDYFGYRWRDSNEPGGPTFEWIDASGGNNVSISENGFVTGVPLGFTFHYYGYQYTTVGVGADGWLSFNGSGNGFPATVPLLDVYAGPLAPYARDLSPAGAYYIRYQTVGSAPNRHFVIEYNTIPDQGGGNHKTFEVILAEGTNSIRFQYLVATNDPEGFGIESPDGSYGMGDGGLGDMFIDPALVTSNYAIEFIGRPSWLAVAPDGGSVSAGAGLDLSVTFDATGLADGVYSADLTITSNDPVTPSVTVPVTLTVSNSQVSGIDLDAVPTQFDLHDNKPNPFNPTTTIAYDLPQAVEVSLVVYDVHGREVRELVKSRQPAGRHSIVWDGRNASSNYVASGVYFYRFTAGSFVRTKKMVLLK